MISYEPLHKIMTEKSMKTEDLAELLGRDVKEIRKQLNGGASLSMDDMGILCEEFRCQFSDIARWDYEESDLVKVNWDKVSPPLTVLAVSCGLSRSAFANAKRSGRPIKRSSFEELIKILKCNPEDIL